MAPKFIKDSVPFVKDSVPFIKDSVPFIKDSVPFINNSVPFIKNSVPKFWHRNCIPPMVYKVRFGFQFLALSAKAMISLAREQMTDIFFFSSVLQRFVLPNSVTEEHRNPPDCGEIRQTLSNLVTRFRRFCVTAF